MPDPLTAPLPPRVVAAMRQLDAALDSLNYSARELAAWSYDFGSVSGRNATAVSLETDYPTACEHLRTAQHAAKAAYRALGAGPERSEG